MFRTLQRNAVQQGIRHALARALDPVLHRLRTGRPAPQAAPPCPGTHPFDTREGVETSGFLHGSALKTGGRNDAHSVAYYGTAPSLFLGAFERWRATPGTLPLPHLSFLDFGSGKGRVLLMASRFPFRQCIGVEMHPGLHRTAQDNIALWQAQGKAVSPVESRCVDATAFQFPDGPCLLYLFNPFAGSVMGDVLAHLADAFAHRPGELDVLYVCSEFNRLFAEHPGFTLLWSEPVYLSAEDAAVDLEQVGPDRLGRPGQQPCSAWRWMGTARPQRAGLCPQS